MAVTADLSCYLVLDAGLCGARGMAETARAAVLGGAGAVQLRLKRGSTDDRIAAGRAVQAAIAGLGAAFIVNDDVAAAIALGADGVHVGQSDMPPAEVRAALGPGPMLGLSVETEAQARAVDPAVVDYAGAGPLRATGTKPDHAVPLDWAGMRPLLRALPVPAVVIGGVTAADAQKAVAAGAVGLAVVSAICGQPDPQAAARGISEALRMAREAAA